MAKRLIRCDRCLRRYRSHGEWNVIARRGVIVGYAWPECQTAEEHAEAEINAATMDCYFDAHGLLRGSAKSHRRAL